MSPLCSYGIRVDKAFATPETGRPVRRTRLPKRNAIEPRGRRLNFIRNNPACHHDHRICRIMTSLPLWAQTAGLLIPSNVFMTFAWYGHLKNLASKPWWIAALVSWALRCLNTCCRCRRTALVPPSFSIAQPEDHAGGDHARGVCAVRGLLHEPAGQAGFSWAGLCLLGRFTCVPGGA